MFVCNYDRKNFIDDHRQKYVEITKNCLGNEIADKRLRFLQTKHLQCMHSLIDYCSISQNKTICGPPGLSNPQSPHGNSAHILRLKCTVGHLWVKAK